MTVALGLTVPSGMTAPLGVTASTQHPPIMPNAPAHV
jgi:hypothetical protein